MVSRLTMYKLQNNDFDIESYGNEDNKLFGFLIRNKEPNRHGECVVLVSSEAIFSSKELAISEGNRILDSIKTIEL